MLSGELRTPLVLTVTAVRLAGDLWTDAGMDGGMEERWMRRTDRRADPPPHPPTAGVVAHTAQFRVTCHNHTVTRCRVFVSHPSIHPSIPALSLAAPPPHHSRSSVFGLVAIALFHLFGLLRNKKKGKKKKE